MYLTGSKDVGGAFEGMIWRSIDKGASWPQFILVLDLYMVMDMAIDPNDPSIWYCGGYEYSGAYDPKVLKSTDGGATWTNVTGDLTTLMTNAYSYPRTLWVAPGNSDYIVTGCYDGVYYTTNGGVNWNVASGLSSLPYVTSMLQHSVSGTLYMTTYNDDGAYQSVDQGQSWTSLGAGLTATPQYLSLDERDGYLYASTFGQGICRMKIDPVPLWRQFPEIAYTTGGTVDFALNAGAANGDRNYLILAGVTGTDPGTLLPGGYATIPLNWDVFTDIGLANVNTVLFSNFMGKLDKDGKASAQFFAPPLPPIALGVSLYFAYCCNNFFDYVSNPVEFHIVD